jgi:hypothetical protein
MKSTLNKAPPINAAESLPGATAPLGFFDPLGMSVSKDPAVISRWRESELKHGRLAMLATVGILAGESVHINTPLAIGKILGPAIWQFQEADSLTGFAFAGLIVGIVGTIEGYNIKTGWETMEQKAARDPNNTSGSQLAPGYINGDLGFDPLGLKPKDAEGFAVMQTKEINNGRLAMIGAAGMIAQELVGQNQGILETSAHLRDVYSL